MHTTSPWVHPPCWEAIPVFLRQLLHPLYVAGRTLNALKRSGLPVYYQFCDTLPEAPSLTRTAASVKF